MKLAAVFAAASLFFFAGCAEINPPNPKEVLESPFGKGPLRIGMTQTEVRELWGEPDGIETHDPDRWGGVKETWTYEGRFPGMPVDVGYTSKTKVLEFDGQNLVSFRD